MARWKTDVKRRFFSTVVLVTSAWTDTTSKSVCVCERERAAESEGCFRILMCVCVCVFLFGAPCSLELQRPRIFSLDLFFFLLSILLLSIFTFWRLTCFQGREEKKKTTGITASPCPSINPSTLWFCVLYTFMPSKKTPLSLLLLLFLRCLDFLVANKTKQKKNEIRTWKVKDKLRGEKKKKKLTSCTNAENCDGGTKSKKTKNKNNLFESCKSLFLLATKCPFSRLVFFPIVRTQRQGKRISFIHSGSFVSPSLQPPSIVLLMAFRRMATCRDHFSFFRQLFLRSTTSEEIRKAMNKHANVGWVQPDITR